MTIPQILQRDELFEKGDSEKIWAKYCGFLDLSIDDFMVIQNRLLMEQIETESNSEIGRIIMRGQRPRSIEEFRRVIPYTTYADYEPYLSQNNNKAMPAEPVIWAHTSGRTNLMKWLPYTVGNLARFADDTLAAFILSSANSKGEVHVHEGAKVVHNFPLPPYTTGIMAIVCAQRLRYQPIPPLDDDREKDFEKRIQGSFQMALRVGADFVTSIAVVLVKIGERFGEMGRKSNKLSFITIGPAPLFRLVSAILKSRLTRRPLLPRDIWHLKGLVSGGTDTEIYRDRIAYYWGVQPLNVYVSTETGFIATQGWDKTGMTFIPYSNFYEFIPEEEWLKSQEDKTYQPSSVLLNEVKEGKTYELVITNYYGGPLLRYRLGDLIKITSLKNERTGVNLPQMVFQSRADGIIDISGFARLDERTIWRAIQNINQPYEEWIARKEYIEGKSVLHIYIELLDSRIKLEDVKHMIDEQLINLDTNYRDLRAMTDIDPLTITLLSPGTFQKYLKRKQAAGFDLAHLKPPHINASEAVISDLLLDDTGKTKTTTKK